MSNDMILPIDIQEPKTVIFSRRIGKNKVEIEQDNVLYEPGDRVVWSVDFTVTLRRYHNVKSRTSDIADRSRFDCISDAIEYANKHIKKLEDNE